MQIHALWVMKGPSVVKQEMLVLTKCSSLLADGCVTLFGSCSMCSAMKEITQNVFKNVTITFSAH